MAGHRVNQACQKQDQGRRRAADLPVRQWLKLGAASAGMGAALLGYSLMGPSGVAAADTTTDSSSSQSASTAGPAASGNESTDDTDGADTTDAADAVDADDEADGEAAEADVEAEDRDGADADADADADGDLVDSDADVDDSDGADADAEAAGSVVGAKKSTAARSSVNLSDAPAEAVEDEPAEPVPAPSWLQPRPTWDETVANIMSSWAARHEAWIESLDVSEERKAELEASFLALRRGLFNQAPTVTPVQLSGLISGAITGDIRAVDAEGDTIVYRLIRGPREGSVVINDDGTYTYTPGSDFDGVDTFYVRAVDTGFHINLLNLFRPIGTRATNLINQGAISFNFNFTGADWTEERREALRQVAASLQEYFRVNAPVTLDYTVNIDPNAENLASASSPYISGGAGYWHSVVQHKLLTGRDANGEEADGEISWNFANYQWELGDDPSDGEYDFVSTAIHEIMHSFGFLSSVNQAGENGGRNRGTFDRNIVTVRGLSPFFLAAWRRSNDPKLTGEDGGLYFGGRNAVAAYGGLIPLFTPEEWDEGSSMSHLNDYVFTGDNQKIMNAQSGSGPGVRVFSALEIGILKDLGYTVVMPESPPYGMALIGFVFLARKRTKSESAARQVCS